jgi:glycine betaine/proline transport system substrate-binding protein
MPTMEADIKPYLENKTVEDIVTNLTGAKLRTVPKYTYEAGLKSFGDIAKFKSSTARSTGSRPAMTATV